MDSYDVAIVGAGLAGLQCARLLGRSGTSVLLLDQKRSLTEKVHTTGIFVRKTLEDFDIPGDCLGPPIRRVSLYSPTGRQIDLHSPHDEFRIGRMGTLYERWLCEAVSSGVQWMSASRLTGMVSADSHSTLTIESGGIRMQIRARFVIAADGAASPTAKCLGLSQNREWIVGVEDVYSGVPMSQEPCFHCFLDPRIAPGYLAWAVNDGHEAHIGVGGYAGRFEPASALREFTARVESVLALHRGRFVERRGGRIPVGGVLPEIANRWGLLAGDAAGAVSPLTAGGLDPCLRLSSLAARVTLEYLRTGDDSALREYDGRRFRQQFTSRLWLRKLLRGIRHPLEVELLFLAMQTPPMRALAWKVFFGRGSFPDVGTPAIRRVTAQTRE